MVDHGYFTPYKAPPNPQIARAADLLKSARSFVRQERADDALEAAAAASELYGQLGDPHGMTGALGARIAATLLKAGPEEAISMARAEFERRAGESSHDKAARGAMLKLIAEAHLAQGLPDEAIASAAQAEALCDKAGDHAGRAGAALVVASGYRSKDQHRQALTKALEVVELCAAQDDSAGHAAAWLAVMRSRLDLGKYEDGLKAAEAGLVIHIKLGDACGKALMLLSIAEAHLANGKPEKALKGAGIALEDFRKMGCHRWEQVTLDVVVEALIAEGSGGSVDDALRAAKTGVAMLKKAGASREAALAMNSIITAHRARGDNQLALQAAQESVEVFREMGDRKHMARMMIIAARLHSMCGNFNDATDLASAALSVCRALRDHVGEVSAVELVGSVEDSKVAMSVQEQSDSDAQRLLAKLRAALEEREGAAFREALEDCSAHGAVRAADVQGALRSLHEKDPEGCQAFIDANYPDSWGVELDADGRPVPGRSEEDQEQARHGIMLDRRFIYIASRYGGMGYGPGFRGVSTMYRQGKDHCSFEDIDDAKCRGIGTLRIPDGHDQWEETSMTHAGIYDQMLSLRAAMHYDEKWWRNIYKVGPEPRASEGGRFEYKPTNPYGTLYTAVA